MLADTRSHGWHFQRFQLLLTGQNFCSQAFTRPTVEGLREFVYDSFQAVVMCDDAEAVRVCVKVCKLSDGLASQRRVEMHARNPERFRVKIDNRGVVCTLARLVRPMCLSGIDRM